MSRPGDRRTGGRALAVLIVVGLGLAACSPDASTPGVDHDGAIAQRIQACAACHGAHGVADNPAFPDLAGQPTSYLVHALKAYRDGTRDNAIMAAQVQGLSDAQIQALAIYYHRQSGGPSRALR